MCRIDDNRFFAITELHTLSIYDRMAGKYIKHIDDISYIAHIGNWWYLVRKLGDGGVYVKTTLNKILNKDVGEFILYRVDERSSNYEEFNFLANVCDEWHRFSGCICYFMSEKIGLLKRKYGNILLNNEIIYEGMAFEFTLINNNFLIVMKDEEIVIFDIDQRKIIKKLKSDHIRGHYVLENKMILIYTQGLDVLYKWEDNDLKIVKTLEGECNTIITQAFMMSDKHIIALRSQYAKYDIEL